MPASYAGRDEGRFPPVERLDLGASDKLLLIEDTRQDVERPSIEMLVPDSVRFVLQVSRRTPSWLISTMRDVWRATPDGSPRSVLLSLRFLYTAATADL